jgi:hypothetical protein
MRGCSWQSVVGVGRSTATASKPQEVNQVPAAHTVVQLGTGDRRAGKTSDWAVCEADANPPQIVLGRRLDCQAALGLDRSKQEAEASRPRIHGMILARLARSLDGPELTIAETHQGG